MPPGHLKPAEALKDPLGPGTPGGVTTARPREHYAGAPVFSSLPPPPGNKEGGGLEVWGLREWWQSGV